MEPWFGTGDDVMVCDTKLIWISAEWGAMVEVNGCLVGNTIVIKGGRRKCKEI